MAPSWGAVGCGDAQLPALAVGREGASWPQGELGDHQTRHVGMLLKVHLLCLAYPNLLFAFYHHKPGRGIY